MADEIPENVLPFGSPDILEKRREVRDRFGDIATAIDRVLNGKGALAISDIQTQLDFGVARDNATEISQKSMRLPFDQLTLDIKDYEEELRRVGLWKYLLAEEIQSLGLAALNLGSEDEPAFDFNFEKPAK